MRKYFDLTFHWVICQQKKDVNTSSIRILVYSADNIFQRKDVRYIIRITGQEIYESQCSKRKKSAYLYTVTILPYQSGSDDFCV